jgi:hypothetical protein
VRVTIQDIREVGYCSRGGREFFARYGLNWPLFVQEGVDLEVLEKIPDPMCQRVVELVKQRAHGR